MVKDIFTCIDKDNIEHAVEALFSISSRLSGLTSHIIVECEEHKASQLQQILLLLQPICKFKVHIINLKDKMSQTLIASAQTHCNSFYMTYARCFSPQVLEGIDAALYVDYDILALKSIDSLLKTNIDDKYCACCLDMSMMEFGKDELSKIHSHLYFNGGVMLFNFKEIKNSGIYSYIEDFLINPPDWYLSDGKDYGEQTLMNLAFKNKFTILDPKYNVQAILLGYKCYENLYKLFGHSTQNDLIANCVLAHMQGAKPWEDRWSTWQAFQLQYKQFMYDAYIANKSQLQKCGIYEELEKWKK